MVVRQPPVERHYYVWTDDITGEWSEPVYVDQCGIDPDLFFDDDGRVYLTSNGPGGLYQCEIDIATGEKLTESRMIWSGTGGPWPEAPHVYKIGGKYYLMVAEGGTYYGHMETIARGDSPSGPWEVCPHNPILTLRTQPMSEVHGAGHGDLVQAHDGSWWMVFLAFRTTYRLTQHLGRETYLAPVEWVDGWPVVYGGKPIGLEMETDTLPLKPFEPEPERDGFDCETLGLAWSYIRNPEMLNYSLAERPGWLRLKGTTVTLDDEASPTAIFRRQQHFDCTATALLDFDPEEGEEAGLVVLANAGHHYEVALTHKGGRKVIVRRRIGDLVAVVAEESVPEGPVRLQIRAEKLKYHLGYALGDGQIKEIAEGSTNYLAVEVAHTYTGAMFGIYATGESAQADFDWFEYRPI
jgi:alpha-N-arabinofuranosidase